MEKITIFGTEVANVTFDEAFAQVTGFLEEDRLHTIITPNTEIVMDAKDKPDMRRIINSADLVVPDGIGLIYGSKMKRHPLKERVTGFDLSMKLIELAKDKGYSLFLLGTKPEIVKQAYDNLKQDADLNIVGYHDGYFKGAHLGMADHEEEMTVVAQINSLKPDIIFLGMGYPKQELWIDHNKDRLDAKLIIGNGGVIDILAGVANRAPELFIKLNLEWLYRLIQEPSRIKRQAALPKFIVSVITHKNSVVGGTDEH
ncbi:WecB/TagA/CpsF family glycosyltransferase [Peptoniphilus equinus]|uniref:N-acetylglucosaminyldiphosphoundecaprenol N-acetyl-beta-D-mannosaminyltransferase n=1 Tax=Peptoniphilus equinus TaxID=3016343 RepID=A0ABY7QUK4_9FIRM|nr:WecB/TagA/CpsF family glycosyltransferase [Peptoniphilus equinus]WBW50463.1 WecB/TagA/CpsF family glycosyltransferase [Peptoniphilus equinus]